MTDFLWGLAIGYIVGVFVTAFRAEWRRLKGKP